MTNNIDRLLAGLKEQADLIEKINQRSDFCYKSIQSLILAYGKSFEKNVKAPFKGKSKSCFKNCLEALLRYPQLNYYEGFATGDDIPIVVSHAWLVNNQGVVIDPTWVGKQFKGNTYFGVAFNSDFVVEIAQNTRCYGVLDNDYMNNHQLLREGFPPHALHQVLS